MDKREHTTLEKCWYRYYTGKQGKREHCVIRLVCTECHCVWDTQGYAFRYCPNCGREVAEIEEVEEHE